MTYDDAFKIQQVPNPFALNPVSFSALASYLECPGCALEQKRRRSRKEPKQFSSIRQSALFGGCEPDPRLVGTLLHLVVNLLHDAHSPVSRSQQEALLANPDKLTDFIRHDLLAALRTAGKLKLAMFFDELRLSEERLYTSLISPMLHYQHELARTGDVVLAASERFHFKLLSTRNTFSGHPDWGGYVGFVGEFDQIRLRKVDDVHRPGSVPAIMEFKKGLGRKARKGGTSPPGLFDGPDEESQAKSSSAPDALPTPAHAMQLMVYWLAFQTRWDVLGKLNERRGLTTDIHMPLHQELDLIIYNLNDGCQYQLLPTSPQQALSSLINCIFFLNWAMKSGYAQQSSEHDCRKTQLVDMPTCLVQVGASSLPASECYALAKDAFDQFKATITWMKLPFSR